MTQTYRFAAFRWSDDVTGIRFTNTRSVAIPRPGPKLSVGWGIRVRLLDRRSRAAEHGPAMPATLLLAMLSDGMERTPTSRKLERWLQKELRKKGGKL